MQSPVLFAPISGPSTAQLESWAGLWGDLLHVDMVLQYRTGLAPDKPAEVFARRALWEGAVIAYGRTFKSGRRKVVLKDLIERIGGNAPQIHDEITRWRDRHVAHRVDQDRETVGTTAEIDPDGPRIIQLRVGVAPATGPDAEGDDLVSRFHPYVETLRNVVWAERIDPLAAQAVREIGVDGLAALMNNAAEPPPTPSARFEITIRPSAAANADVPGCR